MALGRIEVKGKQYEIPEKFTYREMGIIKRVSGCRLGEINDAIDARDVEVYAALAIIAMRRAGEMVSEDDVLDLDFDEITFVSDEEDEASPPDEAAADREADDGGPETQIS